MIMKKRNLDTSCFQVIRHGEWNEVCFSDMTISEMDQVMAGRDAEWLKWLCVTLGTALRAVGDRFDIYVEE